MNAVSIRKFLVATSILLVLSAFITQTLSQTGPLTSSDFGPSMTNRVFLWLGNLFYYLPPILLALWAAHNIRPLRWISNQGLMRAMSVGVALLLAATLRTVVETIADMAPWFPEFDNISLPTLLSMFDTTFYSAVEIALLFFARLQLASKAAGTSFVKDTT